MENRNVLNNAVSADIMHKAENKNIESQEAIQLEEKLHWLSCVMSVRKRKRQKVLAEIPFRDCQWFAECTKTQLPFAILKACLDAPQQNSLLLWPQHSWALSCDFCVVGNSAVAIAQLQSLMAERFSINVSAWWKRYVRYASTTRYVTVPLVAENHCEAASPQRTLHCFVLLNKPVFFKPAEMFACHAKDAADETMTAKSSNVTNDTILVTHTTAIISSTGDSAINSKIGSSSSNDSDKDISKDSSSGSRGICSTESETPPKKKRKTYRCQVCHQPKKGHRCAGLAPPPVPPSPLAENSVGLLLPPPLPPLLLQPESDCVPFESIFVEEGHDDNDAKEKQDAAGRLKEAKSDDEPKLSRLERISGHSFACKTRACRKVMRLGNNDDTQLEKQNSLATLLRQNPTETSIKRSEQDWSTEIDLLD